MAFLNKLSGVAGLTAVMGFLGLALVHGQVNGGLELLILD
jgi:hypothetical protein